MIQSHALVVGLHHQYVSVYVFGIHNFLLHLFSCYRISQRYR